MVAAGEIFIIMTGAMITHLQQGWFMNWFGKKDGEGIEYFIMLLTDAARCRDQRKLGYVFGCYFI